MDTQTDAPVPADPTLITPPPQLLNPRRFRKDRVVDVEIGDGLIVKARKLDLSTMMFEGLISLPLLAAVQRAVEPDNVGEQAKRLALMSDPDRLAMLDLLKRHAVKAVIEPVLTLEDDQNPDHLPVDMLGIEALTQIFAATTIVPVVNAAEVARFRERTAILHGAPAPHGEDVRPAPEHVDTPTVELTYA